MKMKVMKVLDFFGEKLNSFCKLIESKDVTELNVNINSLKIIYQLNHLHLFIQNYLVPLKQKIEEKNSDVLEVICPKEKIHEVVEKFSEEEQEKIFSFLELMIDSVEIL